MAVLPKEEVVCSIGIVLAVNHSEHSMNARCQLHAPNAEALADSAVTPTCHQLKLGLPSLLQDEQQSRQISACKCNLACSAAKRMGRKHEQQYKHAMGCSDSGISLSAEVCLLHGLIIHDMGTKQALAGGRP